MNILEIIKNNLQDKGISYTPSEDIQTLEDGLGFSLDVDIKTLLTEIGVARLSKDKILFGIDRKNPI